MSTFPLWVTEHRAFPVSTKHTISISPYTYEEGVNCQEPSEKQQLPFRRGRQTTRAGRSTAACSGKNSAGWNIDTLRYCDRNFHVSCKREGFFFFFLVFKLDGTVTGGVQNWQIFNVFTNVCL